MKLMVSHTNQSKIISIRSNSPTDLNNKKNFRSNAHEKINISVGITARVAVSDDVHYTNSMQLTKLWHVTICRIKIYCR